MLRTIEKCEMPPNERILAAVSGCQDSLVLWDVLRELRPCRRYGRPATAGELCAFCRLWE